MKVEEIELTETERNIIYAMRRNISGGAFCQGREQEVLVCDLLDGRKIYAVRKGESEAKTVDEKLFIRRIRKKEE